MYAFEWVSEYFSNKESRFKGLIGLVGIALGVWIVVYSYWRPFPTTQQANVVLGVGLCVYYLNRAHDAAIDGPESLRERIHLAYLLVVAVVILAISAYVHVSFWRWIEQGGMFLYTTTDLLVGAALIVITVDATFREFGKAIGGIILLGILYALTGDFLPGIIGHSGMTPERFIYRQTISLNGIFGVLLDLGSTWIAIFVVLAGIIQGHRGFDYIMEIVAVVAERSRSGLAQAAVVSSMIVGSMMGGAGANVATTGSFTIPVMKEHGFPPKFAASVESLASTGGQVMPPIMSIAAFLMADFTGVPYATIIVAGVIPVLMFYFTVMLSTQFKISKEDWDIKPVEIDLDVESRSRADFYVRTLQYLVPLVILVYLLVIARYSVMLTGFYSVMGFLAARLSYKVYRREIGEFLVHTAEGLEEGVRILASLLGILATLGILVDVVSFSGLANKLAIWIVLFAQQELLLVLLLAMAVSLLFGLGMPTPAAYVVVALILAPALVEVGFETLPAHYYVFYFAVLSNITPPVALAVAVACGISGSDFIQTCKETLVFSAPIFLIPFLFILNPELLYWEFPATLFKTFVFTTVIYALVITLIGYNGFRPVGYPERAALLGFAAVVTLFSEVELQLALAVAFVGYLALTRWVSPVKRVAQGIR